MRWTSESNHPRDGRKIFGQGDPALGRTSQVRWEEDGPVVIVEGQRRADLEDPIVEDDEKTVWAGEAALSDGSKWHFECIEEADGTRWSEVLEPDGSLWVASTGEGGQPGEPGYFRPAAHRRRRRRR